MNPELRKISFLETTVAASSRADCIDSVYEILNHISALILSVAVVCTQLYL